MTVLKPGERAKIVHPNIRNIRIQVDREKLKELHARVEIYLTSPTVEDARKISYDFAKLIEEGY